MGKAILVAVVVVCAAALLVTLIVVGYRLAKGPGVRRRDLARARDRYRLAEATLDDVSASVGKWSDIESVLATELRGRLNRFYAETRRVQRED